MELLIAVALGLVAVLLLTRPKGGPPAAKRPERAQAKWADPAVQTLFDRSRKR